MTRAEWRNHHARSQARLRPAAARQATDAGRPRHRPAALPSRAPLLRPRDVPRVLLAVVSAGRDAMMATARLRRVANEYGALPATERTAFAGICGACSTNTLR